MMTPNLPPGERAARLAFALFLFFAAAVLLTNPLARMFAAVGGIYVLWEAATGICPLHARFGATSPRDRLPAAARALFALAGIQTLAAYVWLEAAWEKLSDPGYVGKMAGTLGYFASKNPFPWEKSFLLGFATSQSAAFAYVVAFGELLTGIGLLVALAARIWLKTDAARRRSMIVSVAALAGGALMNAAFFLAAGWTGPGTRGDNVFMFWTEIALIYAWLTGAV